MVAFLFLHAINNAVSFLLFTLFIFAPCSTKYYTTTSIPLSHALNNEVKRYLFSLSITASSSTKYCTIVIFPLEHA